ncbi:MAG: BamA/TamA family outer membrane protein [Candidatus Heimdallarchaeota archaeon]|nr:BamA/TamA family outer membrane protein [Candidatus Heimdallarchaeota archaeon]
MADRRLGEKIYFLQRVGIPIIILLMVIGIFSSDSTYGETELGYDKYGIDSQTVLSFRPRTVIEKIADSPAYFIRVPKEILKKAVVWIEKTHLIDKTEHIYDEITKRGIYPVKTDIGYRHGMSPGVEFKYGIYPTNQSSSSVTSKPIGIQYLEEFSLENVNFADELHVNTWAHRGNDDYRDFGVQLTLDGIIIDGMYVQSTSRYQESPREDYFGVGPNFSIADGCAFGIEEYSWSLSVGQDITDRLNVEVGGILSSVDIRDPKNNDKRHYNNFSSLEGSEGADLMGLAFSVEYDRRDNEKSPRQGGYARGKLGVYEGINGDKYGYTKLGFDIAEYFPVGEWFSFLYWDSALALRLSGEFNSGNNDDKIPFFDLARLGGSGSVRGYQYNRFFDENSLFGNVEYRYNVWGMKQMKVDASVFFDCGWVCDELSEIELSKHKESYGLGLRFIMPDVTFVIEGARSDEGLSMYVKCKPIF